MLYFVFYLYFVVVYDIACDIYIVIHLIFSFFFFFFFFRRKNSVVVV